MSVWKRTLAVFQGGTEQIKKLKGRRIRARTALELKLYDPVTGKQATGAIAVGEIGLVSHHHPTNFGFLLAFPAANHGPVTTLDAIMRSGKFRVFEVNEPTFKVQFDIEE